MSPTPVQRAVHTSGLKGMGMAIGLVDCRLARRSRGAVWYGDVKGIPHSLMRFRNSEGTLGVRGH